MSSSGHYLSGVLLAQELKYSEAIAEFTQALLEQPNDPETLYNRAHAYLKLRDVQKSFADFDKCTQLCPTHGLAHLWKAKILNSCGNFKVAAECFERANDNLEENSGMYHEMGLNYAQLRKFDRAIECFQKCLEMNPGKAIPFSNIAHCLDEQGFHAEAIACCNQAIVVDPTCSPAWYNKAVAHAMARDFMLAKFGFLKFLQYSPQNGGEYADYARSFIRTLDAAMYVEKARTFCSSERFRPPIPLTAAETCLEFRLGDPVSPNWVVIGLLGDPVRSRTLRVFNRRTRSHGALKRLSRQDLARTRRQDEWEKQVRAWIELGRHPNICVPYRIELRNGQFHTFSEYISARHECPDGSLLHGLHSGPVDQLRTVRWGIQICDALTYAATQGVRCHYNLKPNNLLIDSSGNLRVTDFDFGSAFAESDASSTESVLPASPDLFPFVPSDRFHVAPVDERNDIYSIGVLLFIMLKGHYPLAPETSLEDCDSWERIHNEAPIPKIEVPVGPVITRCLAKLPTDRYQDFDDLRKVLNEVHERITGMPLPEASLVPDTSDRLYNMAVTLSALGRPAEALRLCEEALKLDDFSDSAWLNRGTTFGELFRTSRAMYCYEKVIKLSGPFAPLGWNNKGLILQRQKYQYEAIFCFDRALEIDPLYSNAWFNKGKSHEALSQSEEALRCYEHAATIDPRHSDALHASGILLTSQGKWEESIPCFESFLTLEPSNFDGWLSLSIARYNAGHHTEALVSAEKVLQVRPTLYRMHLFKAYCYMALGERSRAQEAFLAYTVLTPPEEVQIVATERAKLFGELNEDS